jgi:proteasome lid subunit RPN8/RPN11
MSPTPPVDAPDVRQLAREPLTESAFPGGRKAGFRVFFEPEVHAHVWKHSAEDVSVEICGVLVGKWARDADGPFVHVSEAIRGEAATSRFAEVTFTHATWAKINEQMDTRFAHLAIVGWYHSHPDFGVFLSDRDRFIQEHFFSGPGQIAHVVDPVRKTEGVFAWREGKAVPCPHYWVGERVLTGEPVSTSRPETPPAVGANSPAGPRADSGSGWLPLLTQVTLFVLLFLAGYLLAGRLSDLDRLRIEQAATARSWLFLKIRPGLREELEQTERDLMDVTQETRALAREHIKVAADAQGTEKSWAGVVTRLDRLAKRLGQLGTNYGLTPQETALLQALGEEKKAAEEKRSEKDKKPPDHKE